MAETKDKIKNILGERAQTAGAYQFDDNKMHWCYTTEELLETENDLAKFVAESNREAYKQGAVDAIKATKLVEQLPPHSADDFEVEEEGTLSAKSIRNAKKSLENQDSLGVRIGFNEAVEEQSRKTEKFLSKLRIESSCGRPKYSKRTDGNKSRASLPATLSS